MTRRRSLNSLNREIVSCRKCPRLVEHRELVARQRKKQFSNFEYWGRPVTGFGDPNARLIVVGLAPAAHGGNRTGRVFTGDSSARFLVRLLFHAGFANQPTSDTRNDGLLYKDCFVTAVVKCVPPEDEPSKGELERCAPFLLEELRLQKNARAILALGKIAFDSVIDVANEIYDIKGSFKFGHGRSYALGPMFPVVFASYHPSPRNTNTGILTEEMFEEVLKEIKRFLTHDSNYR
ncbi:MAG: uracil-DNA glycosylase [Nitrososphaerota archaeon]|nr:uracil-DNA glycosylase [Nitrososphaerota archaeon]